MSKAKSFSVEERIEMTRQNSEFIQNDTMKNSDKKPVIYTNSNSDVEFEKFKDLWR